MFGEPDIQIFIKDKTGKVRQLVKGDYIKRDGDTKDIYRMDNPTYGMTGEDEILGHWTTINNENKEVHHYGCHDFMIWTHCNYLGNDKHYLLPDHTLVTLKEMVKFGMATQSMDFIFGDDDE